MRRRRTDGATTERARFAFTLDGDIKNAVCDRKEQRNVWCALAGSFNGCVRVRHESVVVPAPSLLLHGGPAGEACAHTPIKQEYEQYEHRHREGALVCACARGRCVAAGHEGTRFRHCGRRCWH